MYTTSVGYLEIFFSIAVLFLEIKSTHVKPAKLNIIKTLGKGPWPCSPDPMKSKRDFGMFFLNQLFPGQPSKMAAEKDMMTQTTFATPFPTLIKMTLSNT